MHVECQSKEQMMQWVQALNLLQAAAGKSIEKSDEKVAEQRDVIYSEVYKATENGSESGSFIF